MFSYTSLFVAVTSARRVEEMGALMMDPPHTIFHCEKVFLRGQSKFLPKIMSDFHINHVIHLPAFFSEHHPNLGEAKVYSIYSS